MMGRQRDLRAAYGERRPPAWLTAIAILLGIAGAGMVGGIPTAASQSSPSLVAVATGDPYVWVVSGRGFTPGEELRVVDVRCPSLPCGAGSDVAVRTIVDAEGTFSVTLDFTGIELAPQRASYLVVAFPRTRPAEPTDPTVEILPAAQNIPRPPTVGSGEPLGGGPSRVSDLLVAVAAACLSGGAAAWGIHRRRPTVE
jgi:hypothetical protein